MRNNDTVITEDIKYIGVNDKDIDIFEGQYIVPNGISYNSYLIKDEKNVVMDTIDNRRTDEWLKNLEEALNGEKPDYLVISHLEPDHAYNIGLLSDKFPDMKLVGNSKTFDMLNQFFDIDIEILRKDIKKYVIDEVVPSNMINNNTKIYINPTGRFVIGGPVGDSGLTGRKIIVDTYGGSCGHGGGAFSGKDYTKVDRSASYYARYVAKNIVAAGLCDKLELQVSYAIGVSKPVSLFINTYETNKISEDKILDIIDKVFDFTPSNIIKELNLKKPIYHLTTCFGHMGKENLPWERLDKVESILKLK